MDTKQEQKYIEIEVVDEKLIEYLKAINKLERLFPAIVIDSFKNIKGTMDLIVSATTAINSKELVDQLYNIFWVKVYQQYCDIIDGEKPHHYIWKDKEETKLSIRSGRFDDWPL